jgi:L-arabinose transport system substrate-binding protein
VLAGAIAALVPLGVAATAGTVSASAKPTPALKRVTATAHGAMSGLTFALITINGEQSFFVEQAQGAERAAKAIGAKVLVDNVNASSATTISDVEAAVAQKVSGIIIAPPSNSLGPRIVSIASAAHIPVVAIDNNFDGPNNKPVPLVGINAPQAGSNSGSQLAALFKKSGWSAASTDYISVELPGLQTCTFRTDAEKSVFKSANPSFPSSHILVVPYDGTVEKALADVGPVVVAHPGVQHWLIASCNDDGVVGAGKALIEAHVSTKDIIGIGLGGDLSCTAWVPGAAPSGLVASNYFSPYEIGADAVKVINAFITKHTRMPLQTEVAAVPVTPSNFQKVEGKC